MTAVTKFMFDVQFDTFAESEPTVPGSPSESDTGSAVADGDSADDGDVSEIEEEEEELPGYSEAQLEEAKAESFEAGKQEGVRESASTIEKEALGTLQAISLNITEIFSRQEQANSALLRDGIGIASTIVRKLFPVMNEQNALGEIDRLVEHTLLRLIEEPRVVIRAHPDLMSSLNDRVGDLKAGAGYEGRIILKEDDSIAFGDCRMEWGDGSAERNVASLWQSIDQIIAGNIGFDQQQAVDHGAVEVSDVLSSESEPTDIDETSQPDQNDDLSEQENTSDSMPLESPEGESMKPEEEGGIVEATSDENEEPVDDAGSVEEPVISGPPAPDGAIDEQQPVSGEDELGE